MTAVEPKILVRLLSLLLFLVSLGLSVAALAEDDNAVAEIGKQLDAIEKSLELRRASEPALENSAKELVSIKLSLSEQIRELNDNLAKANAQLQSLGEARRDETSDVAQARGLLIKARDELAQRDGQYRLLQLQADNLSLQVKDRLNRMLTRRLFTRGQSVTRLLSGNLLDTQANPLLLAVTYIATDSGIDKIKPGPLFWLLLVLAGFSVFSLWLRHWLRLRLNARAGKEGLYAAMVNAFLAGSAKYVLVFSLASVFAVFNLIYFSGEQQVPFVSVLAYGLPIVLICVWLIYIAGYRSVISQLASSLALPVVKIIQRRAYTLVLVLFITYLWLFSLHAQNAPAQSILVIRDAFAVVMMVNILWMINAFGNFEWVKRRPALKIMASAFLVGLLLLELIGYRNLALIIFRVVLSSTLALAGFALLMRLFKEFFDALDTGGRPWHVSIRSALGLTKQQSIPGLVALRIVAHAALWVGLLIVLLLILGVSDEAWQKLRAFVVEGAVFGGLQVHPLRWILAAVVFYALYMLSGWLKSGLNRNWFSKLKIERGAREALVTMTGYLGVAIAMVVALGVAGVTFTNLAIIAGALSVGIGFGLQNIVNNFVSGLILLFERPIKTGDWIVVGKTEGYVKKISIRSTQIQTFDRADVLVPNSDLISTQVTNWMLHDTSGRLRIPVGVVYGTDVQKVQALLLQVATGNPSVIQDDPGMPIRVYFLAFAENSLNFELSCYLDNIDERLSVLSALNFAIEKTFRQNGIEFPSRQRELQNRETVKPGS